MDGSPELTAAGYVVADRQSVLAAKFTGRLAKLNVAEAEFVKQGDIVAELDHSRVGRHDRPGRSGSGRSRGGSERLTKLADQADAELAAAQSPLQTLTAENKQYEILLADAQRRLERDEKLATGRAVGSSEVDDRRTEVLRHGGQDRLDAAAAARGGTADCRGRSRRRPSHAPPWLRPKHDSGPPPRASKSWRASARSPSSARLSMAW